MTDLPIPYCQLYLISPPQLDLPQFKVALSEALAEGEGFVSAFQLRLKDATDDQIREAVAALLPITRAHEVAFILNDRVDLAQELMVDGVHLGQDDMPLAEAREILGEDVSIGISCHDSHHLAMEAGEAGADYVAFGAFYPTRSKTPDKLARYGTPTLEILENWSEFTTVPCVAIGGVTPANCAPLIQSGADFIAAINAIWTHEHGPAAAVEAFRQAMVAAESEGA